MLIKKKGLEDMLFVEKEESYLLENIWIYVEFFT